MTESDAALVGRARLGDTAAFEALLRRHFRAAYAVAMAQLGEEGDAEDACQDAFVRCWERIGECREPERFGAWLLRVVRNTAHNRREHRAVRAAEPLEAGEGVRDVGGPEVDLERGELATILRAALARLRDTPREVVLLHDVEGWRHADVAALLGISETMSRRHLSDARRALRELLKGYSSPEEA